MLNFGKVGALPQKFSKTPSRIDFLKSGSQMQKLFTVLEGNCFFCQEKFKSIWYVKKFRGISFIKFTPYPLVSLARAVSKEISLITKRVGGR